MLWMMSRTHLRIRGLRKFGMAPWRSRRSALRTCSGYASCFDPTASDGVEQEAPTLLHDVDDDPLRDRRRI